MNQKEYGAAQHQLPIEEELRNPLPQQETLNRRQFTTVALSLLAGMHTHAASGETFATPQTDEVLSQCTGRIALTFDDGPDGELTPQVLDTLQNHDVKATFFVNGSKIEGNEDIVKRMVDAGHSVQNHTWDHPHLTELTDEEITDQIERTSTSIVDAGAPQPVFVRPPYGDYDNRITAMVENEGYEVATWTNALDTRDWDGPTPEELVQRIIDNLQDGGVVLLHDVQPVTVDTLPEIITALHEKGYCIEKFNGEEFWNLDA